MCEGPVATACLKMSDSDPRGCHCCLQRLLVRRFQASEARECLLNRSLTRLRALPGGVEGL